MKKLQSLKILLVLSSYGLLVNAFAWQLEDLTLKQSLDVTPLVVVGNIEKITKNELSGFAGMGRCYTGNLKISKILKGNSKNNIEVSWCDIAVDTYQEKDYPYTKSVWLLGGEIWNIKHVLSLSSLPEINRLLANSK